MDFSTINKSSSELLHRQIYRVILKAIRSGDLIPGSKIPSINQLSRLTGASRMTVLQALNNLETDGCIDTIPGKGSFVSQQLQIIQNLQTLQGWTEEIASQGHLPTTRLIEITHPLADVHTATRLRLHPGDPLVQIVRVRGADQHALAVERALLSEVRFPDLAAYIEQGLPLYKTLREKYAVIPHHALQSLDAAEVDARDAELLNIPPGKPVLISERITFSEPDDPIELVLAVHKPGFVRFRTQLNLITGAAREITV